MKKAILILGLALAFVGCNKQEGGTGDQYGTSTGRSFTNNNVPSTSTFTNVDTNTSSSQGGASTPGGTSTESKTNATGSNP